MEYEIKRVVEEIDLLALEKHEYDNLNRFFNEIVFKRYPILAKTGQSYPVKKIIMINDVARVEVLVSVKDDNNNKPTGTAPI